MRLLKVLLHNTNVQLLTDETLLIVPKSQPQNEITFRSFLTCYHKTSFQGTIDGGLSS